MLLVIFEKKMNNTWLLAAKLNAIETIFLDRIMPRYNVQQFDYLLVLDLEATCWDKCEFNKGQAEVIEFPCVLFDIKRAHICEEFQQYVMPIERPKLSAFCTKLTGIHQTQVDNGVPLPTCLMLFSKWLSELIVKYQLVFPPSSVNGKRCAFATWSDWDLGTCLKNEAKRKRLPLSDIFSKWMDIRALYKEHYLKVPNGLLGALTDLGLQFEGRQHCGLHDARNTARLIGKMVSDGVYLRLTKDISVYK